jgi:hypothetical protein
MSKKITDLTLLVTPDSTDIVPVVDVSSSTTKKTTIGALVLPDSVTDAKLIYGKVRSRQGGSATNWSTSGTNTYDYSGTDTFTQVGSKTITTDNFVITFPTAFAQVPVVFVTPFLSTGSSNTWTEVIAVTATTMTIRNLSNIGVVTSESVFWMAVGQ